VREIHLSICSGTCGPLRQAGHAPKGTLVFIGSSGVGELLFRSRRTTGYRAGWLLRGRMLFLVAVPNPADIPHQPKTKKTGRI